jgi:hypothetical protein
MVAGISGQTEKTDHFFGKKNQTACERSARFGHHSPPHAAAPEEVVMAVRQVGERTGP